MFSYIEARGGGRGTIFFGLQMFLIDYLMTPFTQSDIDAAAAFCAAHGVPFNREGWEYVLKIYGGYFPVSIKAVPEGTFVPTGNVLVTIECDDPQCFWTASFLETVLLRAVWYPTTVATNSYECKQIIAEYLDHTSDFPEQIDFKLHDFGARGVSSGESAAIGGAAHLVNFKGSDTVEGVVAANYYYRHPMSAFSIPAAEHSTITSWGQENELAAYRNMLEQYGGKDALVAVVSDSYNIFNAAKMWGSELKEAVLSTGGTVVVRPDSGDPAPTVLKVIEILMEGYGFTVNSKNYRVLPNCIRVIQGDGINQESIKKILDTLMSHQIAADNVSFGMGGALLQQVNRDTYSFAMKCSALNVNNVWRDVYKESPGKKSQKGRLGLYQCGLGKMDVRTLSETEYNTIPEGLRMHYKPLLVPVYEKGTLLREWTLDEIRERATL